MNIATNIFLFACMYIVLPLIYAMLLNLSKPKKNIILGVTLPYEARQEQDVQDVCRSYRKHLTATCLLLTVLFLGAFIPQYFSAAMTYMLTWLLLAIITPIVSYIIYHRKLKHLKQEHNWFCGATGKVMLDTKVSVQAAKKFSAWLFAPAVLLSWIPLMHEIYSNGGWDMVFLYGTMGLLVALCYVCYRFLYRQKAEIVNSDTSLSIALTQVRRYNWGKFWIVFSWVTAFFNLGMWLFIGSNVGILITTAAYTAIVLFIAIHTEFSTRKAQENLTADSGQDLYVDNDEHWLIGMFYHNPHDKHIIINDRVGINTTLNLAHPVGKAVMILSLLLLLAMPFFGLWIMNEEFTPVQLTLTDTAIEVRHITLSYSIRLEDIMSAELLEELPPGVKIAGTGMDALLKGKFSLADIGNCELCLNPQTSPFIFIRTANKAYVFCTNDSAQTRAVYGLLKGRL